MNILSIFSTPSNENILTSTRLLFPLQFYDYTELAGEAARQFTEFLSNKFPNANTPIAIDEETRAEVNRRANSIASYALSEDENLLAFAIAAPSIHTVVVKFKDNVTVSGAKLELGQPTTLCKAIIYCYSPPFSDTTASGA